MHLETWLLFCAAVTVLCFTPGPAVMLVVSLSLTRGARAGFGAALGILAGNALYFALSATGIGAIILASWELFSLVRWAGAAYLVWLGVRMFFSRTGPLADAAESSPPPRTAPFRHGLITQGANPNALVFFTAFVPQFIDPAGSIALQIAILGISSTLIELVALGIYVAVCRRARHVVRQPRFAGYLNRVGGGLLVWAGARMANL